MAAMPKTKIMSVAEIEQAYPDEWVAIEITRDARRHEAIRGRVIAHDPDRNRVDQAELAFRQEHPGVITYGFRTTRTMPDGFVVIL